MHLVNIRTSTHTRLIKVDRVSIMLQCICGALIYCLIFIILVIGMINV